MCTDLRHSVQAFECPQVLVSWGVLGPMPTVHRDYVRFGGVRLQWGFQLHSGGRHPHPHVVQGTAVFGSTATRSLCRNSIQRKFGLSPAPYPQLCRKHV